MRDALSPGERLSLLRTLNELPHSIFEEIRIAIGAPVHVLPSASAAQGDRGVALVDWSNTPVGCTVSVLKETVDAVVAYHQWQSPSAPPSSPTPASTIDSSSVFFPPSVGGLNVSKEDRKHLRKAIQNAYPHPSELTIFVDEELNRNLAVIVNMSNPYSTVVFDLIKWAIAKGYIADLVLALSQDTDNVELQNICRRVLQQRLSLNPSSPRSTLDVPLALEPSSWDLEINDEELQSFLPRRSTVEADVGTLSRGLQLANAVCKITFSDRSPGACGTGVLIAPGLVLTNYHVLSRQLNANLNAIAQSAQFEFGYVSTTADEVSRTQRLRVAGDEPVVSFSPINELDYAVLRVGYGKDVQLKPVAYDAVSVLAARSPLNILQHPEGDQMKVSLSNNGVVTTNRDRGLVLYVNETKRGSSGSPCFDAEWKLVALHHKEKATSFGSIREGILFSAIYPRIASFL